MALNLDQLHSTVLAYWRTAYDSFDLAARAKLEIRTRAQGGEWVTLLDATVPNNKVWHTQITIQADEVDPAP